MCLPRKTWEISSSFPDSTADSVVLEPWRERVSFVGAVRLFSCFCKSSQALLGCYHQGSRVPSLKRRQEACMHPRVRRSLGKCSLLDVMWSLYSWTSLWFWSPAQDEASKISRHYNRQDWLDSVGYRDQEKENMKLGHAGSAGEVGGGVRMNKVHCLNVWNSKNN